MKTLEILDGPTIREGDSVTVPATVRNVDQQRGLFIELGAFPNSFVMWFDPMKIAGHEPRALTVGDRVRLRSGGLGYIRAIIAERAWVDLVDDPGEMLNGHTYAVSMLERA